MYGTYSFLVCTHWLLKLLSIKSLSGYWAYNNYSLIALNPIDSEDKEQKHCMYSYMHHIV